MENATNEKLNKVIHEQFHIFAKLLVRYKKCSPEVQKIIDDAACIVEASESKEITKKAVDLIAESFLIRAE